MMRLTRRELLKLGALAAAAAPLRRSGWAINSAGTATESFPVPPVLPTVHPAPGLVEAELVAVEAPVSVAGASARLLTFNGSFPGPTLQVREGEQVRLRFTNYLEEPTNLHFHGLHVPPAVDNPFLEVAPAETVLYEFTIPRGAAGTHWYHPHMHGRVARQLFAGLAGAIVVRGPFDSPRRLGRMESYLIVLKDISLEGDSPARHDFFDWMNGKEGELLLVNGVLRPQISPRRGSLRLRLLNASNARYYRLSLEDHPLYLIATDAGLIGEPVALDELLLAPGERAEVIVQLNGEGNFRLLTLPYNRGASHMMGPMRGMGGGRMGMPGNSQSGAETLLTIHARAPLEAFTLPPRLARLEALSNAAAVRTRRVVLTGGMMGMQFLINGRSFDANRVDFVGRLGDVEVWDIENHTGMDHPMHLHTYPFQVLSRNGIAEPRPAWKDVINIRPGESVRIAVAFRDFGGKTVFHCHIAEHADRGMMSVLNV